MADMTPPATPGWGTGRYRRLMLAVSIIALVVSVLAVLISALSVAYTRRATRAAEESAAAARNQDQRARAPQLNVNVERLVPHDGDSDLLK